jgi:hypothetical protein
MTSENFMRRLKPLRYRASLAVADLLKLFANRKRELLDDAFVNLLVSHNVLTPSFLFEPTSDQI